MDRYRRLARDMSIVKKAMKIVQRTLSDLTVAEQMTVLSAPRASKLSAVQTELFEWFDSCEALLKAEARIKTMAAPKIDPGT